MPDVSVSDLDWNSFPFDREITLEGIPAESATSAIYVSVDPVPAAGAVRVIGRMPGGGVGGVTLAGKIYAAKLPFSDRVVRLQYLGETQSVGFELTSYTA